MKLLVQSDVHTEFHPDGGTEYAQNLCKLSGDVDVLVLAGDIGTRTTLRKFFDIVCDGFKKVLFVPGNHEYYGMRPSDLHDMMFSIATKHSNLTWLHNSTTTIDGQRFIGGTLWFPDNPNNWSARRALSDFNRIYDFVPWVYEQNACMREVLHDEVKPDDIVVTHHLPHSSFISPRFRGEAFNCFFVGDVRHDVVRIPKLWIFGHTHDSLDEVTSWGGRFVCNPYGYKGHELNPQFNERMIVTV